MNATIEKNFGFETKGSWSEFLNAYKNIASEELLKKIWEFGNMRWTNGYNTGRDSWKDE